jgi:hypothetical protein
MNPETLKMVQRILAELAGIGLLIWGLIYIYRGIAGKINFLIQGKGVKVKLINASPGVFISLIGAFLVYYSMADFSIERKSTTTEVDEATVLAEWLDASNKVTGDENYTEIIDKIAGKGATNRFKVSYFLVYPSRSLGDVAQLQYGDEKFWKLIAAINAGKDYYPWPASKNTFVKDSSLLEIWNVSKFYGKTTEEIVKISAADKRQAYQELLQMASAKPDYKPLYHFDELSNYYKLRELSLVQTPANFAGGVETIGDLALKYYGDKQLWQIIRWTNPEKLSTVTTANEKLESSTEVLILHFSP